MLDRAVKRLSTKKLAALYLVLLAIGFDLQMSSASAGPFDCYTLLAKNQAQIIDFAIEDSVPVNWQPFIIAAAKTWNDIGAAIRFNPTPNPNSLNRIALQSFGSLGAYAISNAPDRPCLKDGQVLGLCIVFNKDYNWSVESRRPRKLVMPDVQGIATHEFGHWLGLDDISALRVYCRSVMKPVVIPSNTYNHRFLTKSDIEFVRQVYNNSPIANAGPDQTVLVNSTVQLDGRASSDPDGDVLRFSWTILSNQNTAGCAFTSSRTISRPTVRPSRVGSCTIQLIVNDSRLNSAPSRMVITARTDITPPVLINNFQTSDNEDGRSTLTWRNPSDNDLAEVMVRRKLGSYPANHNDGEALSTAVKATCNGGTGLSHAKNANNSCVDTGLTNGATYYYAVFSRDLAGNWNDQVSIGQNADTGTPQQIDTTPPTLITDFNASDYENSQSTLSWTNPSDSDLAEVIVQRKTDSYPADHTDGITVYSNTNPTPGGRLPPLILDLPTGRLITTLYLVGTQLEIGITLWIVKHLM